MASLHKWLCLSLVYAAAIIGIASPELAGSKYLPVELEETSAPAIDYYDALAIPRIDSGTF